MKHLSVLFLLLLSSCSSLPDVPICRPRTPNTGFCAWTISDKQIIINDTVLLNGKTWTDIKIESVLVPVDSWVKIKEYFLKQCKKYNDCNKEIASWENRINSVNP